MVSVNMGNIRLPTLTLIRQLEESIKCQTLDNKADLHERICCKENDGGRFQKNIFTTKINSKGQHGQIKLIKTELIDLESIGTPPVEQQGQQLSTRDEETQTSFVPSETPITATEFLNAALESRRSHWVHKQSRSATNGLRPANRKTPKLPKLHYSHQSRKGKRNLPGIAFLPTLASGIPRSVASMDTIDMVFAANRPSFGPCIPPLVTVSSRKSLEERYFCVNCLGKSWHRKWCSEIKGENILHEDPNEDEDADVDEKQTTSSETTAHCEHGLREDLITFWRRRLDEQKKGLKKTIHRDAYARALSKAYAKKVCKSEGELSTLITPSFKFSYYSQTSDSPLHRTRGMKRILGKVDISEGYDSN